MEDNSFYRKHLYSKVEKLKTLINRKNAATIIEIDGGVTNKNARQLADAGADVLVAGSYVFGAQDPIATIADLKDYEVIQKKPNTLKC